MFTVGSVRGFVCLYAREWLSLCESKCRHVVSRVVSFGPWTSYSGQLFGQIGYCIFLSISNKNVVSRMVPLSDCCKT